MSLVLICPAGHKGTVTLKDFRETPEGKGPFCATCAAKGKLSQIMRPIAKALG